MIVNPKNAVPNFNLKDEYPVHDKTESHLQLTNDFGKKVWRPKHEFTKPYEEE